MSVKRIAAAALAAMALSPLSAFADDFDKGLDTIWESLWHQSGATTPLARWEGEIRVAFVGAGGTPAQRATALSALRETASEAGARLSVAKERAANFTVEILPNGALSDNEPCATSLNLDATTRIDSGALQMRASEVARCSMHEAMHAMGVRGHPTGDSVLSYAAPGVHKLSDIDRAMLRAWYSPKIKTGMTPFEALPVLAGAFAAAQADPARAAARSNKFMARTVEQMESFAEGKSDPPAVLRRSGKITAKGLGYGRAQMSYFLGLAYQLGTSTPQDPARAARWLERAAQEGDVQAKAQLDVLLRNRPPS